MALRPGPSHPCPLTCLTLPQSRHAAPLLLSPSRTSHDVQLIIFFEASRLIDRALWLEFIITFDLSAVSPRGRPDCSEDGRRVGLHFPGFISSPTPRRPRNEDPIIESQRFSFLPRYLRYRGEKRTAISTLLLLRFLMIGVTMNKINLLLRLFKKKIARLIFL